MNYLSHFYFYHKKDNPYFNCGLIFPDWLAAYKRTRLFREISAESFQEQQLKEGIGLHYYADRTFHGSTYFKKYAHGIKLILETTTLDKNKYRFSFLSHVILEIMIDRLLLQRNPESGVRFYENLDACDEQLLVYFAQKNSRTDSGFLKLMQQFKHYRFILGYTDNEKFMYSVTRIAGKVGIVIEGSELQELIGVTDTIENYVEHTMNELFVLFQR